MSNFSAIEEQLFTDQTSEAGGTKAKCYITREFKMLLAKSNPGQNWAHLERIKTFDGKFCRAYEKCVENMKTEPNAFSANLRDFRSANFDVDEYHSTQLGHISTVIEDISGSTGTTDAFVDNGGKTMGTQMPRTKN